MGAPLAGCCWRGAATEPVPPDGCDGVFDSHAPRIRSNGHRQSHCDTRIFMAFHPRGGQCHGTPPCPRIQQSSFWTFKGPQRLRIEKVATAPRPFCAVLGMTRPGRLRSVRRGAAAAFFGCRGQFDATVGALRRRPPRPAAVSFRRCLAQPLDDDDGPRRRNRTRRSRRQAANWVRSVISARRSRDSISGSPRRSITASSRSLHAFGPPRALETPGCRETE